MTTMRKLPGHVSRDDWWYTFHHQEVMRADSTVPVWGGRGWVGPSSFQALTAAALPGFGATVTSHPRDILKGASQQGDEFWVDRCGASASAVVIYLQTSFNVHRRFLIHLRKLSAYDKPVFWVPPGIWSIRQPAFLQCCGIALSPVSLLVLGERCQMGRRRLCMSHRRARRLTTLIARTSLPNPYRLRKYLKYLASTSSLRVYHSAADGWVLYVLG